MQYANLERDTLGHVTDEYYFGAYCRACKHHGRMSLSKLRAHLGDNFRLAKIRERLRCERCGERRQVVVTFLAPDQMGKFTHLFERKPRP